MKVLRIQRSDANAHTVTLVLQGRIVAEWADLLERECAELMRSKSRVVLDLSEVVFIGRYGVEALGRLARAGARVIGCTPLVAAMLEQEGIAVRRLSRVAQDVSATQSRPTQTVRTRKEKSS
jgi:anti-anti-sigma regulatory factor